jgi:hypothetical protein
MERRRPKESKKETSRGMEEVYAPVTVHIPPDVVQPRVDGAEKTVECGRIFG